VEPDYVRERPTWVRGEAQIDGDEIVLDGGVAEEYVAFDPKHATRLFFDLANLAKLGEEGEGGHDPHVRRIDTVRLTDTGRALEFAKAHGLLRHGPGGVGKGETRESLRKWYVAGLGLMITTSSYISIKQAQEEGSVEPVRSYLRSLRDVGHFRRIVMPDDELSKLLEWASIQLAENISRHMAGCAPRLNKVGAGEFVIGNDPDSLVGAAYYQLAVLISRKAIIRICRECGELFPPTDPRQWEHTKCGNRRRKREQRARDKVISSS
jgi:hypothetical protein